MKLLPLKQWICDSCGELIEKPQDGWLEYLNDRKTERVYGFRIVHYDAKCYYPRSNKDVMVGDRHLEHMLESGGFGHMLHWLELSQIGKIKEHIDISDYTEIMRRLYLLYWEEARQYWDRAFKDGFHDGCCFSEQDLIKIINEYSEK
ncbi:MAG: hypothetical protein M0R49_01210 [Limnochordia bacterium]|jgi:hypothetical protein|nr:hypothetical protein [Limnochordia bacterium]